MGSSSSTAKSQRSTRVPTHTSPAPSDGDAWDDSRAWLVPTYVNPALSERDAWDIAMAWRDQLRGCVRLELDSEEIPSSIIPVFEWVTFIFHGTLHDGCREVEDRPKAAAYARTATIAWFALSCCQGYGGRENPRFWKRVFYELLYPEDLPSLKERSSRFPHPEQHPITDAIRFFVHPDRPFPRMKLSHGSDDDSAVIASVFLGRVPHEDKERDTKLQCILAKLQPLIRESDVKRRVPVELDLWNLPTATHAELFRGVAIGEASEVRARAADTVILFEDFPQLYLRSVKFTDDQTLDIQSLYSLIPPSDVEVLVGGRLPSFVQDHQLWRGLLDQLQTYSAAEKRHCWRMTHVHVMQNTDLAYSFFSVLCSSLPHLHGVHSLKLPTLRYFNGAPACIASDWAWLGYAIFHPDAASISGLRSLEVDLDGISRDDIAAFTRMAVGNSLLGEETTGYLEGLIRSGTEVKISQGNDDSPNLYTFAAESWMSMCTQAATETVDHPAWVSVVIPGFGSGWVQRANVIKTHMRRAGESCIRTLRVKNFTEGATQKAVLGLLRVLGSRLTSLHFVNSNHMSASAVHAILRLCPSLKSLRIRHDGSFWADEALAMAMPRLEELELTVHGRYAPVKPSDEYSGQVARYRRIGGPPPHQAWERGPLRPLQELKPSCLPYLKALHVISARYGAYEQHESVLVSFLTQQPLLQYLHWSRSCSFSPTWADAPAYRRSEDTHKFLARLPVEHHLSLGPLHLNCRVAFLSVLAAQQSAHSIGEDAVRLIFKFSSTPTLREIFMSQFVQQAHTI